MSSMVFEGLAKRFFLIVSSSDEYAPLHQLTSADVADYPTRLPENVCFLTAARPDFEDLAFCRLMFSIFTSFQEALGRTISTPEKMRP